MGLFGRSFEEQVHDAVHHLGATKVGLHHLRAAIHGKVVTLEGEVTSAALKEAVMREFNSIVRTENTVNHLKIAETPVGAPLVAGTGAARDVTGPHAVLRHPAAGQAMAGAVAGPGVASAGANPPPPGTPLPAGTAAPPTASPEAAAGHELRVHQVGVGETLGSIAKRYYGNANKYLKIFEANRHELRDPNRVRVGQKLRIPD